MTKKQWRSIYHQNRPTNPYKSHAVCFFYHTLDVDDAPNFLGTVMLYKPNIKTMIDAQGYSYVRFDL